MLTPDSTHQLSYALLLVPFGFVLVVAFLFSRLILRHSRKNRALIDTGESNESTFHPLASFQAPIDLGFDSTRRWCAIRSTNTSAVQAALDLRNPRTCFWRDGILQLAERTLLISPPAQGWIIVIGRGLPDPADDVDECFHFLRHLSRSLGWVQFFSVNRAVNHHAWAQANDGEICRAYAWGGETLWNEGLTTPAEIDLDMVCFKIGEPFNSFDRTCNDLLHANTEKVHQLAARWSVDPSVVHDTRFTSGVGIVGDLLQSKRR